MDSLKEQLSFLGVFKFKRTATKDGRLDGPLEPFGMISSPNCRRTRIEFAKRIPVRAPVNFEAFSRLVLIFFLVVV